MSRYKFDRSREFIPGYKVGCGHWRSVAVQTIPEPEIYHDAVFKLRADARVRVQEPLQICLECRSKSKKCDKQLTHIVRVIASALLILLLENCLDIEFKITRLSFASSFKSFGCASASVAFKSACKSILCKFEIYTFYLLLRFLSKKKCTFHFLAYGFNCF